MDLEKSSNTCSGYIEGKRTHAQLTLCAHTRSSNGGGGGGPGPGSGERARPTCPPSAVPSLAITRMPCSSSTSEALVPPHRHANPRAPPVPSVTAVPTGGSGARWRWRAACIMRARHGDCGGGGGVASGFPGSCVEAAALVRDRRRADGTDQGLCAGTTGVSPAGLRWAAKPSCTTGAVIGRCCRTPPTTRLSFCPAPACTACVGSCGGGGGFLPRLPVTGNLAPRCCGGAAATAATARALSLSPASATRGAGADGGVGRCLLR
jgi:hypothetical protein